MTEPEGQAVVDNHDVGTTILFLLCGVGIAAIGMICLIFLGAKLILWIIGDEP